MQGLLVFTSMTDALRAGYTVRERISEGYIVNQRFPDGWKMAVVVCRPQ